MQLLDKCTKCRTHVYNKTVCSVIDWEYIKWCYLQYEFARIHAMNNFDRIYLVLNRLHVYFQIIEIVLMILVLPLQLHHCHRNRLTAYVLEERLNVEPSYATGWPKSRCADETAWKFQAQLPFDNKFHITWKWRTVFVWNWNLILTFTSHSASIFTTFSLHLKKWKKLETKWTE